MPTAQTRTDDEEDAILQARDLLKENVKNLEPRDQSFANSLLSQLESRGLTAKQIKWLLVLMERAVMPPEERQKTKVGDLQGVMALFDFAAQHTRSPTIILGVNVGAEDAPIVNEYRVWRAGERARVPGSINVADTAVEQTWFGRILQSGDFEQSPRVEKLPPELIPALRRFAEDPARVATESAKLTGRCMFCNKRIGEGDDPRSIVAGYGPVCAKNFGLPWS